jgi:hypothetical protein
MAWTWWKLLAFAALVLVAWIAWVGRMARASTRWPATQGRVLEVWFDEVRDDDIGDSFVPRIRYAYAVRGRSYVGHRLRYRVAPLRDHRESMHALRDIAKGDAIQVHYDPDRPQRAVLFPGADAGNLLDLFAVIARVAMSVVARMLH